MFQLNALLQVEKDENELQELRSTKDELETAITYSEANIRRIQGQDEFIYSTERLQDTDVGRVCKAFFEKEKKWFNAQVLSVDAKAQTADVQFIGYNDQASLHAVFIKILQKPDPEIFQAGT